MAEAGGSRRCLNKKKKQKLELWCSVHIVLFFRTNPSEQTAFQQSSLISTERIRF